MIKITKEVFLIKMLTKAGICYLAPKITYLLVIQNKIINLKFIQIIINNFKTIILKDNNIIKWLI